MSTPDQLREEWREATEVANGFTAFNKASGSRYLVADNIADWWLAKIEEVKKKAVEGIVKWAKDNEKFTPPDRSNSPMFTYKDVTAPYNRGYNTALKDIINFLHPHSKDEK